MKISNLSIEAKTDILIGLFITALIAANLLGTKITSLFGVAVSVGIFAYPITFLITDIIAEVHGKKKSFNLVLAGFISLLVLLGLTQLSVSLPANAHFQLDESYRQIFQGSVRIILASLTAFILSQLHDVWAFHRLKEKTSGKFLWLRNNLSTIVSQFLDTIIFMFIAFYQITPKFDALFIWQLILPYYLFKVAFAALDTPFVYLGVRWLKKGQND